MCYGMAGRNIFNQRGHLREVMLRVSLLVLSLMLVMSTYAQVTHTVQGGETLTRIAARYGLQVEDVAVANGITDINLIEVGQQLQIPIAATPPEQLPWPFAEVDVSPTVIVQGQVARVRVGLLEPAEVSVRFINADLAFAPVPSSQVASSQTAAERLAAGVTNTLETSLPPTSDAADGVADTATTSENEPSLEDVNEVSTTSPDLLAQTSPQPASSAFVVQGLVGASVLDDIGVYDLELRAELAGGNVVTTRYPIRVAAASYERESITISPQTSRLLDPTLVANERARIASLCTYSQAEKLWEGTFSYPVVDPVRTSLFGTLRSFNGGPFRSFHGGLDLRANSAVAIYAPANGEVILAAPLSVRGNTVVLRHGLGVCSLYAHLSLLMVEEGDVIDKGTLIGYGGSTGLVTGAHLHWEIRVGNVLVDPAQWANQDLGLE
jgi:murein DD-endopeptidase MepM/ murein hydrolase activator NlpD